MGVIRHYYGTMREKLYFKFSREDARIKALKSSYIISLIQMDLAQKIGHIGPANCNALVRLMENRYASIQNWKSLNNQSGFKIYHAIMHGTK